MVQSVTIYHVSERRIWIAFKKVMLRALEHKGKEMTFRQLFGTENAATDDLLEECYVPPPHGVFDRPILVGKWGTGKTGLLLHRNAALTRALRGTDRSRDRLWYVDETGIQLQTLKQIQRLCGNDEHSIKRFLEDIWRSEILRTTAQVLVQLKDFYKTANSEHWKKLTAKYKDDHKSTVWETISALARVLLPGDKEIALDDFMKKMRLESSDQVYELIQSCLRDIAAHDVQPVVAIEPIETPTSQVEEKTDLAQLLVTCLLNVFYKHFQPSSRQLIRVEMSIPWHRYDRDQVGEPQKLYPFMGRFRWTKPVLREFINRRIEWEFKRIGRPFARKGTADAWDALFPGTVKNRGSGHPEEAFDYLVRHSQYRVRDVLRLTRECVEHESELRTTTKDDVLYGRGGLRLSERAITSAVAKTCRMTANERVIEGERRFPGLREATEALRGMKVPFTSTELKKRLQRRADPALDHDFLRTVDNLWNSGIIGVQLKASSLAAVNQLIASFDTVCMASRDQQGQRAIFYVFEHATDRRITEILKTFDGADAKVDVTDIALALTVHPMLFEHLDVRVEEPLPVGV